jgi:DNA-binding NarL/FixJ family response regulator
MGPLATPPTILIAEDHPMISIMLNDMIRELVPEAKVLVVDSVEQAKTLTDEIQLVITDLDLLDSKGFETVQALSGLFPDSPCLICSGVLDSTVVDQLRALGCHHVNKACSYSELFLALQSFFLK